MAKRSLKDKLKEFLQDGANENLKLAEIFRKEINKSREEGQSTQARMKQKKMAEGSKPEDILEDAVKLRKNIAKASFLDANIRLLISKVSQAVTTARAFDIELDIVDEHKDEVEDIVKGTRNFFYVEDGEIIPANKELMESYEKQFEEETKNRIEEMYNSIK